MIKFGSFKKNKQRYRKIITPCKYLRRGMKAWAFSRLDLANLLNVSARTIQRYIDKGRFDPTDLLSIVSFYNQNIP